MHTSPLRRFSAALMAVVILAAGGCDTKNLTPKIKKADPLWAKYISAHTSGWVSKKSKVNIVFIPDLFPKEMVGQSAQSLVETEPKISGAAVISGPNEISIIPDKDLPSGQNFLVRIKAAKINALPQEIGDYEFIFSVIKQAIEVNVEGLITQVNNDKEMELKGWVVTADTAEPEKIEKLITVTYRGSPLQAEWTHDAANKRHLFSVSGITRQAETQKIELRWDGGSIGVDEKGGKDIEVTSLNVFKLTSIEAIQDEQQYILVYFSDNLDSKQNLKGLIQIYPGEATLRVENNAVKIYPKNKFIGKITTSVQAGIRNIRGEKLAEGAQQEIIFASQKPQVKFAGMGNILPDNSHLSIPIETMNVNSVQVTAFRVFENNMGQFLQTNKLDGTEEIERVGRALWRKTIHLPTRNPDNWQRFDLDATDLVKNNPGGLFRLTVSINRENSLYSCSAEENAVAIAKEEAVKNNEDLYVQETSSWDYFDNANNINSSYRWQDREDPCKDSYYQLGPNVKDSRNFVASNIGLLVKGDQNGKFTVAATNLRTAEPLEGAAIEILNFQDQVIGTALTGKGGLVVMSPNGTPFYLTARKNQWVGHLKLNQATALQVSHFDIGGEKVQSGIKGLVYGERGVWRPGDEMHLVFVLEDKGQIIPKDHPVIMRLFNPQGQIHQSLTNNQPMDGFYKFTFKTSEDSPTGNWTVKAQLGDRQFSQTLKVETVIPNRLKIDLDFGEEEIHKISMPVKGKIISQWLHGAPASKLKTDVEMKLSPIPTVFTRFTDHHFDDPSRSYAGESEMIFEGFLNEEGKTQFKFDIPAKTELPGKMKATFKTRVFEGGGAFSTSVQSMGYHPYNNYIGVKLPKGDQTRGMLLTDVKHSISIASLNSKGDPVSLSNININIYKIGWKWWWDKTEESLAQFISSNYNQPILQGKISTKEGKGNWDFEIKYPDWGRYLIRACDQDGAHCAGQIVYIDWPGWAGRAQEQGGGAASTLTFFADKAEYEVGDKAVIQLPEATQGRALITIENGSRILDTQWVEFSAKKTKFELPITAEMSPNVYVSATLVQPHQAKNNDRPIRLYGVIPLLVKNPKTVLEPVIESQDEWIPESKVQFQISEKSGKPMTYTVAVVDEGLLGLTNFKTPDLHKFFYKKEALGVATWDLFDYVVGAYGGELERLLALGGDDDLGDKDSRKEKRRFPPVVRFLGPFKLEKNETQKQTIDMPAYVGAVRIMVVAGKDGAYGRAEKSVFVRQALSILVTLPRILRPSEWLTVPVAVFSSEPGIKKVQLSIETDPHFSIEGDNTTLVQFSKPGEQMGFFKLKSTSLIGQGEITVSAVSSPHKTRATTNISILPPNSPTVVLHKKQLDPGQSWTESIFPHGLLGTNEVSLEITSIPPLNLEKSLDYLIRYPHGCVEQVTSSVFPQLHLGSLIKLTKSQEDNIEKNIAAGIEKLRQFQVPNGAFVYWPGGFNGQPNLWATNYAGHFLVEADRKGHFVPADMLASWGNFQSAQAQSWDQNKSDATLDQAYRLYTLALAGKPEIGAMNRMQEIPKLPNAALWQLAAAYQLAGVHDAAEAIAQRATLTVADYLKPGPTFGSTLRDKAIILDSLAILNKGDKGISIAESIAKEFDDQNWHSTQSLAYTLLAMARFYGADKFNTDIKFEYGIGAAPVVGVEAKKPVHLLKLDGFPEAGASISIKNNGDKKLFASVVVRGIPKAGEEKAASEGLTMTYSFTDLKGNELSPAQLIQGADIESRVIVQNISGQNLENLAMVQLAPSGWEINNPRLGEEAAASESVGKKDNAGPQNPYQWWWSNYQKANTGAQIDYQDTRDDRINSYFDLKAGESIEIRTRFNASYIGRYYLPGMTVEAMYEASKHARKEGTWVTVEKPAP